MRREPAQKIRGGNIAGPTARPSSTRSARTDPERVVQSRGRSAGAAGAAAASRDAAADRPGRPRALVPDGADRAGGQPGARDRDPRRGARRLPPVAADAALPRAPARALPRYAGPDLLQVRRRQPGRQPQAQHRGRRRPTTTRTRASRGSRPRPAPASGARRWRSPAACSASRSTSTWSR